MPDSAFSLLLPSWTLSQPFSTGVKCGKTWMPGVVLSAKLHRLAKLKHNKSATYGTCPGEILLRPQGGRNK
jgi:hypothetical protein